MRRLQEIIELAKLEPSEAYALIACVFMAIDNKDEFAQRAGSMGIRGLSKLANREG